MPHSRTTVRPSSVVAFLPLMVASAVHLVAILLSLDDVVVWTKPLLMPALAIGLVWAAPIRRSRVIVLGVVALFFSWAGDVTLVWFVIGLACFLIAHIAYLVLFVTQLAVRRMQWWAMGYAVWLVVLLVLLVPNTGDLAIPVVIYGTVLCGMAAVASRCNRWIALGGAFFVASDSILAINLFLDPGIPVVQFLIMGTYIAAQTLIVWGIVQYERRRVVAPAPALADPVRNPA
ncbi:lysoplasmalogenase [Leifsonia sp. A12D58]|uniref:lysoplasmalogenase n=1 Tax=Leifsonia sp. A12D58 TaxID=3397674 RepID=UPI0039DFD6CE